MFQAIADQILAELDDAIAAIMLRAAIAVWDAQDGRTR
jgi:hypothetical protein